MLLDIGCDFYAVTGHKLYGRRIGRDLCPPMRGWPRCEPVIAGAGDMNTRGDAATPVNYNDPPNEFEAARPDRATHRRGRGADMIRAWGCKISRTAHEKGLPRLCAGND